MAFLKCASIVLAIALPTLTHAQEQTCYFPDGVTISPNDVPCNSSSTTGSACCGQNTLCMDNGLCLLNGVMSRGSCTDPKWGSGCARYCETESPSGGITLQSCSGFGTNFSCFGQCDPEHSFDVPGGSAVMLRDAQVKALGGTGALVVAANTTLHVASSNGGVVANTTEGSNNATVVPTSSFTSIPTPQSGEKKYTAADMAGVGLGVGLPLALALAGTLFLLFKQRRQNGKPDPQVSQEKYRYSPQTQTEQTSFPPMPAYQPGRKQGGRTTMYGELDSSRNVVNEMDSTRETHELPNNWK